MNSSSELFLDDLIEWTDNPVESLGPRPQRGLKWRTSSACPNGSACVEIAMTSNRGVLMRDKKDPQGPVLSFSGDAWDSFVAGARAGEFTRGTSA